MINVCPRVALPRWTRAVIIAYPIAAATSPDANRLDTLPWSKHA